MNNSLLELVLTERDKKGRLTQDFLDQITGELDFSFQKKENIHICIASHKRSKYKVIVHSHLNNRPFLQSLAVNLVISNMVNIAYIP